MAKGRTADDSSSDKRKHEGDDESGNRKKINLIDLQQFTADDEDIMNDDIYNVYITTSAKKTICLEVKGSDPIGNIKVKLQTKTGVPHDEQALIFDECVLDDIDTLDSFLISKDSTLTLMRKSIKKLNVFVKTIKETVHSLEVKPSDTIEKVKNMIPSCFSDTLMFNGVILEDTDTVADSHIINNSTLMLLPESQGWMEIYVKVSTGETISLTVNPRYTICNVKNKIESRVDIPSDKQVLIFNEMVLEDSSTLVDFQITRKSTLTLLLKSNGSMQIFVKIDTEKTIMLDVKLSDTINNVIAKIKEKEEFVEGQMSIMFNGKTLEGRLMLADYHIKKESTLTLLMPKSNGLMQIFVKMHTGKTITLDVKQSDTVNDVIFKIKEKEVCVTHSMNLMFNGRTLDRTLTLADCHVQKASTLRVRSWI
ncbi:polyubiquitin-like [Rutidosis leptorrhynchoides]|uniref:polyubiquitin-like n=1 Tax=Rutidosis leptorrhynchoides TaxID=125765 RepID=UPI003A9A20C7